MYWFPKPYPDELVGSVFVRAMRWKGFSYWTLKERLGITAGRVHLIQARNATPLAEAIGMSPRALLQGHTLLPYATALLNNAETEDIFERALSGADTVGEIGRIATAIETARFRRFCPVCRSADLTQFGETYWHRRHHLPGIDTCDVHGCRLTKLPLPRGLNLNGPSMPGDFSESAVVPGLPAERLLAYLSTGLSRGIKLMPESLRDEALGSLYATKTPALYNELGRLFGASNVKEFGISEAAFYKFWDGLLRGRYLAREPLRYLLATILVQLAETPSLAQTEQLELAF